MLQFKHGNGTPEVHYFNAEQAAILEHDDDGSRESIPPPSLSTSPPSPPPPPPPPPTLDHVVSMAPIHPCKRPCLCCEQVLACECGCCELHAKMDPDMWCPCQCPCECCTELRENECECDCCEAHRSNIMCDECKNGT
ncbi:sperm mitochondrial-associated cysteine-rich protein-like [Frankliniella occidentalis]|uniref:Sperm mitochondrial-associated cysteine-rich protein-like n=1 Tax=Frankliniella occidentalis TaxID=133901 RepID=A0A9C6X8H5_FRAOC|nr:sperm mitochondrial-associated cysteine-rich protein-like [Frankliniella occidentalis]